MTSDSNKKTWSREGVFELIAMYQNSPALWDVGSKDYNNRALKTCALESIAEHFETSVDQVLKKVHNLRSQLAQELKKQATRKSKDGSGLNYVSKWPYIKVLSFLAPETPNASNLFQAMCNSTSMPITIVGEPVADPIMLDLPPAEICELSNGVSPFTGSCVVEMPEMSPSDLGKQVDMRPQESYEASIEDQSNCELHSARLNESRKRCADSEPASEEVLLKAIRVLTDSEDEFQVFGRYIASELRGLGYDESRRQLKRAIQRAVLEASEMDDMLRLNRNGDPLTTHR